jgi:hypothetical protein
VLPSLYNSTDVQKGDFPAGRRDFVGNIFTVVQDLARDRRGEQADWRVTWLHGYIVTRVT